MIHQRVLLDTSAIVACFLNNEQHHSVCTETLRLVLPPLFSTWPVITEAHYLLRSDHRAQDALVSLAKSDALSLVGLDQSFLTWFVQFASRYDDHDVQIADASLVWLAEKLNTNVVFTLDRRDFSTFRIQRSTQSEAFRIIPGL